MASLDGAVAPAPPPTLQDPPSLSELFLGFAKISVSGIGMILPWARRLIVEQKRWMTPDEFNEAFSLAQFLPGPNVVNMSVVFGSRMRGAAGAAVALAGLLGPPFLVVIGLSVLYAHYGDAETLRRILAGISAAAIGLIIAVVAKMAEPIFRRPFAPAPFIAVATFAAVGVFRLPLVLVLAILVPLSIALAWWWTRK